MKVINIKKLWHEADGHAERDISQDEVAKVSGVTQQTISKMKNGGKCQAEKLAKVAEALYEISGLPRPEIVIVTWI